MKNILFITLLFSAMFTCTVSCVKKKKCENTYRFEFSVKVTPTKETYALGDTIWINFAYDSNNLLNLNENTTVDIGDLDLAIDFGITRFNDTIDVNGIDYFNPVIKDGDLQRVDLVGVSIYNIQFTKVEGLNQSKFGLIPNSSGDFAIEFNSILHLQGDIKVTDTSCIEYLEAYQFNLNNNAENGYNFYINNIEAPYSEVSVDDYQKGGVFSFRVE